MRARRSAVARLPWLAVLGFVLAGALPACSEAPPRAEPPGAWVEIRKARVAVDVAATPAEQRRGLSGRRSLDWGTGMVFIYKNSDFQRFWMIDMNFPIDMVWIRDARIVGVHHRVPVPARGTPNAELPRYGVDELVDTVLEVPAGFAEANGWARGDVVLFGGGAATPREAL